MHAARCVNACGAVRECTLLGAAGVRGPEVLAEPCGRVVLAARARQLGVLDQPLVRVEHDVADVVGGAERRVVVKEPQHEGRVGLQHLQSPCHQHALSMESSW